MTIAKTIITLTLNVWGLILFSACAGPQPERGPHPLLALLNKCQPENSYVRIATSTHNFIVKNIHSDLLEKHQLYMCDTTIEEHSFICAVADTHDKVWILTEDISVLSQLYRTEKAGNKLRNPLKSALEACRLTRAFYRTFTPIIDQKTYDNMFDKAKNPPKFEPFKVEQVKRDSYKVTGCYRIGRDMVRRTVAIDRDHITFADEILAEGAGTFMNDHEL